MDEDDLPYCIETHCEAELPGAEPAQIRRVVQTVLQAEGCPAAEISVALLDGASVRQLNARYLNRPEETDVLAFDLTDEPVEVDACAQDGSVLQGQVVVNVELAGRRAAERGTDPTAELMLYVVHGCLHLLGRDDAEPEQAASMHRREDELLEELGYGRPYTAAQTPADEGG